MNRTQIFKRMALDISFGERDCDIIGKRFHRLDVINVYSPAERDQRSLSEWTNTILPFAQCLPMIFTERVRST